MLWGYRPEEQPLKQVSREHPGGGHRPARWIAAPGDHRSSEHPKYDSVRRWLSGTEAIASASGAPPLRGVETEEPPVPSSWCVWQQIRDGQVPTPSSRSRGVGRVEEKARSNEALHKQRSSRIYNSNAHEPEPYFRSCFFPGRTRAKVKFFHVPGIPQGV